MVANMPQEENVATATEATQTDSTQTEQETNQAEAKTQEETKQEDGKQSDFTPITSQEQLNHILGERLKREREKYADYEALKERVAGLPEIEEQAKKAAELEEANAKLSEQIQLEQWKKAVEKETGIPADILKGTTEDELREHAQTIKNAFNSMQKLPTAPVVATDTGGVPAPSMSKADILAIDDESERKAAIAANLNLFV